MQPLVANRAAVDGQAQLSARRAAAQTATTTRSAHAWNQEAARKQPRLIPQKGKRAEAAGQRKQAADLPGAVREGRYARD